MPYTKQVYNFAIKWCDKFREPKINYIELVDHYMADDCEALEFEMDCGNAFSEIYGKAASDYEELNQVIDEVNDIKLLGSAIYSQWRYFNHWAYSAQEILDFENRSWFVLALSRLAILTGENQFAFKGIPQKIRLVTNAIGYGTCPKPNDIVEQHITINSDGGVWLSEYAFGEGFGKYKKVKSTTYKIEKVVAENVLNKFATYFSNEHEVVFARDTGSWELKITDTKGKTYKFEGSLYDELEVDGISLSELIRDAFEVYDLYVFDNRFVPDKINRITVDYYRACKIELKEPTIYKNEHYNCEYKEQLIIDRKTESIEHIQNMRNGSSISHKYKVQGGISKLLDDFDADSLFEYVEVDSPDEVDNQNEIKGYCITVDYKKNCQLVIKGSFDKKGLPYDFADFAETVVSFIEFYGVGEILNPSIYEKVKRHPNDYIFCSVIFYGGDKSYYYLADDDSIKVGDSVLVPVGNDNHTAMVEVVDIEYFSEGDAPLLIEKTKHIIRKCTDDDFDIPIENDR